MSTESISINVDADAARTFCAATPMDRRKIEMLLSLRLRELTSKNTRSLREVMDEIGTQAEARGLTPDTLESFLREE